MDDVVRNGKRKHRKGLDLLLLTIAGLVAAGVGTAVFWIADNHHATVGVLAAFAALGFFIIIGKTYGIRQLKSLPFAAFSMVWLLIHVCVFLIVVGNLGLLYYLPFLVAELFVGFMVAIWLFGLPTNNPP